MATQYERITDPQRIRALAHPLRLELMDLLGRRPAHRDRMRRSHRRERRQLLVPPPHAGQVRLHPAGPRRDARSRGRSSTSATTCARRKATPKTCRHSARWRTSGSSATSGRVPVRTSTPWRRSRSVAAGVDTLRLQHVGDAGRARRAERDHPGAHGPVRRAARATRRCGPRARAPSACSPPPTSTSPRSVSHECTDQSTALRCLRSAASRSRGRSPTSATARCTSRWRCG